MKVEFSFLSQNRSFIGFEISRGGYLSHNMNLEPVVRRTIDIGFGFIFGWMTIQINHGGSFNVNEIVDGMLEKINKEQSK